MTARIFFSLCLFERLQNLVSDRHGVRETLQPRGKLLKFVVAEVAVVPRWPESSNRTQSVHSCRSASLTKTHFWSLSTPVTSPRITVVFLWLRRIPRIGEPIWLGDKTDVAT